MLRRATNKDHFQLLWMLHAEGVAMVDMRFALDPTYVLENERGELDGFFTFNLDDRVPYLAHFCVSKPRRSMAKARELAKAMIPEMLKHGRRWVTSIDVKKPYIAKFLKYYFKPIEYAVHAGQVYYMMEVSHGKGFQATRTPAA